MTTMNIINEIQKAINIYNANHVPNHMDSTVLMQIYANSAMLQKAGHANYAISNLIVEAEKQNYNIYLHKTSAGYYDVFSWSK